MTDSRAPAPAVSRITPAGWLILGLLVTASILFFIDRQTLAILKSTLATEFNLTNADYSALLTAYMLPYTLGYLVSGQLIDRWGTRRCAVAFLFFMSLATVACGLARNFHELLAARVLLGLAESGVVPSIYVLIAQRYPADRRGFIITLHQALQSVGPIMTAPLVAFLTLSHGWRSSFMLPGVLGFIACAVWFVVDRTPRAPAKETKPLGAGLLANVRDTLTNPALRGVLLARIVTDPAWFFLIYWQSAFLQERGGWTLEELGRWTWLPPAAAAISNVSMGLWSDRLLRGGSDPATARRRALQGLAWFAPAIALAPFLVGSKVAVLTALVVAYFMANTWLTLVNVLVTELAAKDKIATSLGVMSALGGTMSMLFNYVAGPLVDRFGYTALFVVCGCLHPLGAFILYRSYRRPAAGS